MINIYFILFYILILLYYYILYLFYFILFYSICTLYLYSIIYFILFNLYFIFIFYYLFYFIQSVLYIYILLFILFYSICTLYLYSPNDMNCFSRSIEGWWKRNSFYQMYLITVFCNSDDSRWLSFLKWLLIQRKKIWNIGRIRKANLMFYIVLNWIYRNNGVV